MSHFLPRADALDEIEQMERKAGSNLERILSAWELDFLESIKGQLADEAKEGLSPKQTGVLEGMVEKVDNA